MFVKRISGYPTQAQITELEQMLVAEIDSPAQVTEAGQSVLFIGEFANDRGQPLIARRLQAKGELESYYGGFLSWLGSSADGWEGNGYVKLWGLKFPDLIIMVPDLEAGEVTFSGDAPAEEVRIPAGTRISNGSTSIWATLEEVVVDAGTYGAAEDVRVRHVSGTGTQLTGAIDTIVDTFTTVPGWTVANAATCTAVVLATAYQDALDAAMDETSLAADCSIVWVARHTQAVMTALGTFATDASSGRRGRIAITSPPIGTTQAGATGSATVWVGARRSDRTIYAWPGVKWLFPAYDPENYIVTHFDGFVASQIAHCPPEQSPGQSIFPYMARLMGTEDGISCTRAFYKSMKDKGICSLNIDRKGNRLIYSAVTTSLTSGKDEIAQRRFSDMVTDSLAENLASFKDMPLTETNKGASKDSTDEFMEGLVREERCEAYSTNTDSVNTPSTMALGIWKILLKARRIASARFIVLMAEIGANVTVTEVS
jgi:hypothetical protein